jgi:hypothetical protein
MKITTPTPAVFLPSAGLNERRATLHIYDSSEVLTLKIDGKATTGLAHFYRCSETGERRRYGFDVTFAQDNGGN